MATPTKSNTTYIANTRSTKPFLETCQNRTMNDCGWEYSRRSMVIQGLESGGAVHCHTCAGVHNAGDGGLRSHTRNRRASNVMGFHTRSPSSHSTVFCSAAF